MAEHQGWNSSVPESTELARIYSRRLDRRSLKRVSHSCWLRRLLLHRRECNFIRSGAAFRLREKNSQRRHAIRIRALLRIRGDVAEKVQIDERSALSIGRTFYARTCENRETAEFVSGRRLTSMTFFDAKYRSRKIQIFPWF